MAAQTRIDINTTGDLAGIGVRLLDDAYLAWVTAEVESEHALRAWFEGATPNSTLAYLVYRAAVDREAAAARDLQRLYEITRPCQDELART